MVGVEIDDANGTEIGGEVGGVDDDVDGGEEVM